jgi:hypothetical protein
MEAGEEIAGSFFVAGSDASEMLDDIEEAFDEVSLAVERKVTWSLDLAVGLGWDDHRDTARFEIFDEAVGVIALIAEKGSRLDLVGQQFGLLDVVNLSPREAEYQRIAERIDDGMDLGRQSTARTAYRFIDAVFLGAPALC